jgi:hypothetical protein
MLDADGGFDVVLPEELTRRLVANTKSKPQCPLPSGKWADQIGDLPKCWFIGDGKSCVFHCNHGSSGVGGQYDDDGMAPLACNLSVCNNLTLAPSKAHFICAETGTPCPAQ